MIGALLWFFKITKVVPFESVEVFRKDPFLTPYFSFSSSMIFLLFCFLPSAAPYADDLAIWSSFPSVPNAVEATQGALFRLERWSKYWRLLLNQSKCEASTFQFIPTKLTSSQTSSYSTCASVSLQPFLGSPSTTLFPFLNVTSLKAKLLPRLTALRCISASSRGPSLFCIRLFFDPLSFMLYPDGILS